MAVTWFSIVVSKRYVHEINRNPGLGVETTISKEKQQKTIIDCINLIWMYGGAPKLDYKYAHSFHFRMVSGKLTLLDKQEKIDVALGCFPDLDYTL